MNVRTEGKRLAVGVCLYGVAAGLFWVARWFVLWSSGFVDIPPHVFGGYLLVAVTLLFSAWFAGKVLLEDGGGGFD